MQFVVRVQRGYLVTLGQSRIVEGRRQEIVQPPTQSQDSLSDVDQLGCAGADGMNAEEAVVFSMEEQFHRPLLSPRMWPRAISR